MHWMVLLDRRHCRLIETSTTAAGRLHLEERAQLEETWEEHEHLRQAPSISPDRGSHTDWEGQDDERKRRFAGTAADWLDEQVRRHELERLVVFCAPGLLAKLQAALAPALAARLDLHGADLAGTPLTELLTHRAVLAALEPGDA
jgi:protein required for attachment to host cells